MEDRSLHVADVRPAQGCQVRGCCCGIPFGCGSVLTLLLAGMFVWHHVRPEWILLSTGVTVALLLGITFVPAANTRRTRPRRRQVKGTGTGVPRHRAAPNDDVPGTVVR